MHIPQNTTFYETKIGHYGIAYPDLTDRRKTCCKMLVKPCLDHKARPYSGLQPVWFQADDDMTVLLWTREVVNDSN